MSAACDETVVESVDKVVVVRDTTWDSTFDTTTIPESLWLTEHDTIYSTIIELSDTVPHACDAYVMATNYVAWAIRDYADDNGLEEPMTWFARYTVSPINRTTYWEVNGRCYTDVWGPYNNQRFYCEIRYTGGDVAYSGNWVVDTLGWDVGN